MTHIILQALYPAPYRESKYEHFYASMHFGLLDLERDASAAGRLQLRFRAIDHAGRAIMDYSLPLKHMDDFSRLPVPPLSLRSLSARTDHNATRVLEALSAVHLQVEPIRGKLPRWRLLLFKVILVVVLMVCTLAPVCFVFWLLFAGVYRATRGHDDVEEAASQARVREVQNILAAKNAQQAKKDL